uniref:Protein pellino n=1 Tax=Panagrolaimus sp. JU765 TaxID=591449 RepID=A0AC34QF07_9BILA
MSQKCSVVLGSASNQPSPITGRTLCNQPSPITGRTLCDPLKLPTMASMDNDKLSEIENDSPNTTPIHAPILMEDIPNEPDYYGELILLGYNGQETSRHSHGKRSHRSKMGLKKREIGNGVKKGQSVAVQAPASQAAAVQDKTRHVVSYTYSDKHTVLVEYVSDPKKDMFQIGRSHVVSYTYSDKHTVLVEYVSDPKKDMFQIGRSSEPQIDFSIVDTWLEAQAMNHDARYSVLSPIGGSANVKITNHRAISSTISRYACRILADRDETNKVYVYAAGFDSSKNIFLGEKATKWQKKNGEVDGLTTNGVLILHPNRMADGDNSSREMYEWREVSVDGDIYSLRETRSSQKRGTVMPDEMNQLQDGTLIDLCGATLLWRSAEGLKHSPSRQELERRLDELNAGKPQCPVNLNTLIVPKKKASKGNTHRQPYVYMRCGHVQGKHDWGISKKGENIMKFKCPICMVESERVITLSMGMEPAFHLDSDELGYAFNPCGHVASLQTVRYWSRIPLPHGTNSFHPVCPFCTSLLSKEKPYVRLIFQDHCDF